MDATCPVLESGGGGFGSCRWYCNDYVFSNPDHGILCFIKYPPLIQLHMQILYTCILLCMYVIESTYIHIYASTTYTCNHRSTFTILALNFVYSVESLTHCWTSFLVVFNFLFYFYFSFDTLFIFCKKLVSACMIDVQIFSGDFTSV